MIRLTLENLARDTHELDGLFDEVFNNPTAGHDPDRFSVAGYISLDPENEYPKAVLSGTYRGADFEYSVRKSYYTIGEETVVFKTWIFEHGDVSSIDIRANGRPLLSVRFDEAFPMQAPDLSTYKYKIFGVDFTGNSHANRFEGGSQRDVLAGLGGDDVLYSRGGADRLIGDAGADTLAGGLGTDRLAGGYGADRFVFTAAEHSPAGTARDVIVDFGLGADMLDLSHLAAGRLEFIGRNGFGGADGEVRFAHHVVAVDLDGDTRADLEIRIKGDASLAAADFHL